jgi:hypothetical protein
MSLIDVTLATMRREMRPLLETAMEGVLTKTRGVLEDVLQQLAKGLAVIAEERARGLAEVAEERQGPCRGEREAGRAWTRSGDHAQAQGGARRPRRAQHRRLPI